MNKYIYTDSKTGLIVFEVYADNIITADKQFEFTVGTHPQKLSHILCAIHFIDID